MDPDSNHLEQEERYILDPTRTLYRSGMNYCENPYDFRMVIATG